MIISAIEEAGSASCRITFVGRAIGRRPTRGVYRRRPMARLPPPVPAARKESRVIIYPLTSGVPYKGSPEVGWPSSAGRSLDENELDLLPLQAAGLQGWLDPTLR
jgi:hypothetical protein